MPDALVVRRCRACGEAAVVPGLLARSASVETQGSLCVQRSRCQSCGRRVPLCSRRLTAGLFVAGLLLAPIGLGLPLMGAGWWLGKQDAWNPVVPDAPVPPVRYRTGPRPRTCGVCGGACIARGITRQRVGILPAGSTVVFQCESCGVHFGVENFFGLLVSSAGGLLFFFGAWDASRGGFGRYPLFVAALFLIGGIAGCWMVFAGLRLRWRNPVRTDDLLD